MSEQLGYGIVNNKTEKDPAAEPDKVFKKEEETIHAREKS